MKKIFSFVIFLVVVFECLQMNIFASEYIVPYSNNTKTTNTAFYIDESGTAKVEISFVGYVGETNGATIKTKIEKRFLLVFWNDVASWTDEVSGYYYANEHTTTVKKGTYRATVEYTIRGTGGDPDVITDQIEQTY